MRLPMIPPAAMTRRRGVFIIATVAIVVYALSLFNMFAYDDVAVIRLDSRIHSLSVLRDIFSISYWNNEAQALYRPLVTGSFAIDWAIAENRPAWYHFINMLWNAAACVLAFLVLAELFPRIAALAGALVFTVHPVHVEAVANIVGRAELMAATFAFAAALLWIRSPRRIVLLAAVPALFGLALLSKESAIMLPPLLVLFDVASGRLRMGTIRAWFADRFAPLALVGAAGVAFLLLRASVIPTLIPTTIDAALEVAPHGLPRVVTALQVWPHYVRLFLFPVTLLADYGPRIILPQTSVTPTVFAGMIVLAGCTIGGIVAAARGHGRTALALLWVPVSMLPVSNLLFPIGIILAERTLYMPVFALALAVAALVAYAESPAGRARLERMHASRARVNVVWVLVLVLCTAFAVRTLIRIPDWKNTPSIFRALARSRPDSFRAHWHFARKAAQFNQTQEALQEYGVAVHLWPYRLRLLKEASDYALRHGDLKLAATVNAHGIRAWPADVDFRRNMAGIALDMGDSTTAAQHVKDGLRISPEDRVLNDMNAALGYWMLER